MKPLTRCLLLACFAFPLCRAVGQEKKEPQKSPTLFNNVQIFDGKSLLPGRMNLLVG